ncbi:MAG: CotH kinase family protein [Ignavibacteriales bacterium]|nr:CotH kinase family protein [Ignavibacteriales bacterium]
MKSFRLFFVLVLLNSVLLSQVDFKSSNLPIIIINTHGHSIKDEPKIIADMGVIDNGKGITNKLTDAYNVYNGKIGIEIRGHSSQMFPKKQYGIELIDSVGNSVNAGLLGMPSESDWVLNASFTDKTFLRNTLSYKLGNDIGRYSSRTAFCEVVINNKYMGLYILQEKVKRDKNRVNIKKLEAIDVNGEALTGGYIMKIDRIDPGDKYFNSIFPSIFPRTPGQPSPISYIYVYPNAQDILPVQQDYIKNYITQFETSLSKSTYNDPFLGYYDFIDVDALVDYFLINEFVKSVDAYRLSAYLYKNRDSEGGKLVFGPIWDYDLSFGLADYGDAWLSSGWEAETNPYEGIWSWPFWTKKIFDDPIIRNKLAKRWNELKQTVFNLTAMMDYIDKTVLYINQARTRNFVQWAIIGVYQWPEYFVGQSYEEEVLYLKAWIIHRFNWIDTNLSVNYSDVEWLPVDFSKIKLEPSVTKKLPISLFAANLKNISTVEFRSADSNINFKLVSDSVEITINKQGDYNFKVVAKYNNKIVSISPGYTISITTGVSSDFKSTVIFKLSQNYPNPFNPSTTINYLIPKTSFVTIKLYDVLGNEIATMVNEEKLPGNYKYEFNGDNISSGIYFYRIQAGNFTDTKKFILMK